jgi:hypothetical protein
MHAKCTSAGIPFLTQHLGRRNFTDDQRSYWIGKQLEYQKKGVGGPRYQNDTLLPKTRQTIAKQHHVGEATVERNARFAHNVDAIAASAAGDEARAGFPPPVLVVHPWRSGAPLSTSAAGAAVGAGCRLPSTSPRRRALTGTPGPRLRSRRRLARSRSCPGYGVAPRAPTSLPPHLSSPPFAGAVLRFPISALVMSRRNWRSEKFRARKTAEAQFVCSRTRKNAGQFTENANRTLC